MPEPVLVEPGDVLAVHTPGSLAAELIRLGAALADKPNLSNHIAVAHHEDASGTLWVIEGRPGGVGWRQASDYLADRSLLTNIAQPKTAAQRAEVCLIMTSLLGTSYDWEAIAADAAEDIHFDWHPTWGNGKVPGHVVCSSLAAYAYDRAQLLRPHGNARTIQPADWDAFILDRTWEK